MSNLLQALHGFVANEAQLQSQTAPQQQQGWGQFGYFQPQPGCAPPQQQSGGMLGGFLNSGFGRTIEMGAGFGIGDDLINKIF